MSIDVLFIIEAIPSYFIKLKHNKYILLATITACVVIDGSFTPLLAAEQPSAVTPDLSNDPYERLNKKVFSFNDGLDKHLLKPVAKGYNTVTPSPVGRGVTNFFNNLGEPRVIINDVLQGKIGQAASDTLRFAINTTVGIGGIFDVAKHAKLKRHKEDFGQTLAKWGVKRSSYFVIPLLGPSSVRDTFGELVDFFTYPLVYFPDTRVSSGLYVLQLVNRRANLLNASDILDQAAGEYRYEFVREAYRQQRNNEIYDGEPPLDLPYMLDDEEPDLNSEAPS